MPGHTGKEKASPWLTHKTMGFPFRKKKKKTLSFPNMLPNLHHRNTNKVHVTAAKGRLQQFTHSMQVTGFARGR